MILVLPSDDRIAHYDFINLVKCIKPSENYVGYNYPIAYFTRLLIVATSNWLNYMSLV